MEQVGEENECGRRANTYVTWACVLRSLSFEPDMVKDSAPVSSTPSESSDGRGKEREGGGRGEEGNTKGGNAVCQPAHVRRKHQRYSRVETVNTAQRRKRCAKFEPAFKKKRKEDEEKQQVESVLTS